MDGGGIMAAKGIRGGQLKLLSEDNVKRIHHATLDALNDVGIRLPHRQALELWADHGARVGQERLLAQPRP